MANCDLDAAVRLGQPVLARSFKTREGGITEKGIDGSDEMTQKYQEIASDLKVQHKPRKNVLRATAAPS